jgi:DNA-binding IscR family transcriptional regulator
MAPRPLIVRKDGYRLAGDAAETANGQIVATVDGNTRFDIELVRR